MNKTYNAIAICSPYGVGKTTVTEQLFSYFEVDTFVSSRSVALKQFPLEENVDYFTSEILKAKSKKKILILNPYISDLIKLIKNPDLNVFNIFLNANKSTIENHLTGKGLPSEEVAKDVLDAIYQLNIFENNRDLFHFMLEVDEMKPKDIAGKITTQLFKQKVIAFNNFKIPYPK